MNDEGTGVEEESGREERLFLRENAESRGERKKKQMQTQACFDAVREFINFSDAMGLESQKDKKQVSEANAPAATADADAVLETGKLITCPGLPPSGLLSLISFGVLVNFWCKNSHY
ncbi:hypothetical protein SAY87_025866 [Trapa incisa]|uniref:Uncharacterized protein n=1 Tax=Trapa incisa TaxID=236973 RepID=A0AAN7JJG8_9MYRT|nr:hypothetical protein SAY87_025866 [Trapa incisa]